MKFVNLPISLYSIAGFIICINSYQQLYYLHYLILLSRFLHIMAATSLTNPKILTGLSQIDSLLSFLLFIVENFFPYPDSRIHALILSTSILSVFMSLIELYCIGKKEYWQLLLATLFRLGPIVSISLFWMICSKRFVLCII